MVFTCLCVLVWCLSPKLVREEQNLSAETPNLVALIVD